MKKSLIIKSTLGSILGVGLAFGTVFAVSDPYQKVLILGENEFNQAKSQIQADSANAAEREKIVTSNHINEILSQLNTELDEFGEIKTAESTIYINGQLKGFTTEIKNGNQKISGESNDLFNDMVERVSISGNSILNSYSTEDEQFVKKIQYVNYDQSKLDQEKHNSTMSLENEINFTINTINQLKEMQASEENEAIKDFIQRKIDLLSEIINTIQN